MTKEPNTFCVYPWIHQMTTPDGKVNFCCISAKTSVTDESGRPFQLGIDKLSDAWNSQYMKSMRQKMLDGQKINGCENCYKQEAIGKRSYRQMYNEEWNQRLGEAEITNRIKQSVANDYAVNAPPVYLDLRLGNLCNLKCRMCNPYNSIQIHNEWTQLDNQTDGQYSKFWQRYNLKNENFAPWYESEHFWSDVASYIPNLKKVYMTGGEPTLIESNYKFLDLCVEMGYAKDIELFFNLNFTNLKDKFIEQLKHFKWTHINASLDGFGQVNEYIRGGSSWEKCSANITKLLDSSSDNIGLGFSPVIQAYNILSIDNFLDYVETLIKNYNRDILVDFLYCFDPLFLDFAILPKNIKMEALSKINVWKNKSVTIDSTSPNAFFLKNSIESLLNRLEQTLEHRDNNLIQDFIHYTKTLDKKRNQSIMNSFPQLTKLLNEEGYAI